MDPWVWAILLLVLGMGLLLLAKSRQVSKPRWVGPAVMAMLLILPVAAPGLFQFAGRSYVGIPVTLALALGLWLNWDGEHGRALYVWFALAFGSLAFWFRQPRTHIHTAYVGAALILALELDAFLPRLSRRVAQALGGVLLVLWVASAAYLYVAFVDHTPEYKRTYPQSRMALFPTSYGDTMPTRGLFGFPYRAGWKVIGDLYATGELQGDYGTNEETHITGWYTRGAWDCSSWPRYLFVAEQVQDAQPVPRGALGTQYQLIGEVRVEGQVKLRMYERQPARFAYREFSVEDVESGYDWTRSAPDSRTSLEPADPTAEIAHPRRLIVGEGVEFLGHSLEAGPTYRPGQAIHLILYWRALKEMTGSCTVFTHVEDPGVLWAQKDAVPLCDAAPTNTWRPGEVYVDRYVLVLDPATPLGEHALYVGMYCADNGERLPVWDTDGALIGDGIHLGTVTVAGG